jgi:hypothetical protein
MMGGGALGCAYYELPAILNAINSLSEVFQLHARRALGLSRRAEAISDFTTLSSSPTNPICRDRLADLPVASATTP